jgi:PadR family transcriptional regulator, regulatory protein AphA
MPRSSRTAFAVLGMLAPGPASGYDVKRRIDSTIPHFWSESFGQIYPILRQLEGRGFVRKRDATVAAGPRRHVYAITPAGRSALRAWLAQPAELPRPRNELLLKLFFGSEADPAALSREIRRHRDRYRATGTLLKSIEKDLARHGDPSSGVYPRLTLRYGIRVMDALVEWCREAERELRGHAGGTRAR